MLHRTFLVMLSLFSILLGQTVVAQEAPATVPESFHGSYATTHDLINSGGPFGSSAAVTFIMREDNALCIGGQILLNPITRDGNLMEAIWEDDSNSVEYAISNLMSDFNEVNITGTEAMPFYGQLSGSKTSDATDCGIAPIVTAEINSVIDLAESKLPEFFPAGAATQFLDAFIYRFYETTGIFLAFADGNVFLLGGAFGEVVVDVGAVSLVRNALEDFVPTENDPEVELWNLTITGSASSGGTTLSFNQIDLVDVPAPDLESLAELNNEVLSTLDGAVNGISQISIQVLSNTETERSFRVTLSGSLSMLTVDYDLTYSYTR